MPPIGTFYRAAGYFGTLAHETIHWTGATKRLDHLGRFNGCKAYAYVELVAETGNRMLCAQIGVEPEVDQNAVDYIMDRIGQADQMAVEQHPRRRNDRGPFSRRGLLRSGVTLGVAVLGRPVGGQPEGPSPTGPALRADGHRMPEERSNWAKICSICPPPVGAPF